MGKTSFFETVVYNIFDSMLQQKDSDKNHAVNHVTRSLCCTIIVFPCDIILSSSFYVSVNNFTCSLHPGVCTSFFAARETTARLKPRDCI